MKRVKVMLLAIAVIALAAGTLAFKASRLVNFCTTIATTTLVAGQPVPTCTFIRTTDGLTTTLACPNLIARKFAEPDVATATVCTTVPNVIDGEQTCVNTTCTIATTKLTVE